MVGAVRGTVNGTVLVAVAEGLLIGIAYVVAGVPSPVLFTMLTIAFAMVPFGAWAAFAVASVVLLISDGNLWPALAVFGWGAAVMLAGDHFIWPTLVGKAARLPFLVALIGIFGGLQVFGLIGLFLGPVIMAALLTVWREWLVRADDAERQRGDSRHDRSSSLSLRMHRLHFCLAMSRVEACLRNTLCGRYQPQFPRLLRLPDCWRLSWPSVGLVAESAPLRVNEVEEGPVAGNQRGLRSPKIVRP